MRNIETKDTVASRNSMIGHTPIDGASPSAPLPFLDFNFLDSLGSLNLLQSGGSDGAASKQTTGTPLDTSAFSCSDFDLTDCMRLIEGAGAYGAPATDKEGGNGQDSMFFSLTNDMFGGACSGLFGSNGNFTPMPSTNHVNSEYFPDGDKQSHKEGGLLAFQPVLPPQPAAETEGGMAASFLNDKKPSVCAEGAGESCGAPLPPSSALPSSDDVCTRSGVFPPRETAPLEIGRPTGMPPPPPRGSSTPGSAASAMISNTATAESTGELNRLLLRVDELLRERGCEDTAQTPPMLRVPVLVLMLDSVFSSKVQHLRQRCEAMQEEATNEVSGLQLDLTQLLRSMGPNEEAAAVMGEDYSRTAITHLLPSITHLLEDLLNNE